MILQTLLAEEGSGFVGRATTGSNEAVNGEGRVHALNFDLLIF